MGRLHAISCLISFRPGMWITLRHLHAGRDASVRTLLATLALPIQALLRCKLEPAELHKKTSWPHQACLTNLLAWPYRMLLAADSF